MAGGRDESAAKSAGQRPERRKLHLKANGAGVRLPRRLVFARPAKIMASTAKAYRNSDGSQSAKKSDFLSRSDIAELLDAVDFSCDVEATIVRRAGKEKGHRHYRRGHLVTALKGVWRAATSPYGTGEILCFASVEGYAIEAVTSERAMRYKLRELERIGVIELVYAANTIRRPATYRLNISKLRERCRRTYQDVKNSRPAPTPLRPRASHASHRSSPQVAQEAAATQHAAAPVPAEPRARHSAGSFARALTSRQGK